MNLLNGTILYCRGCKRFWHSYVIQDCPSCNCADVEIYRDSDKKAIQLLHAQNDRDQVTA